MMGLYKHFRSLVMVPRFPPYRGRASCGTKQCGKGGGCGKSCGMNLNLIEEVLCGIQARVTLYLMTPTTGKNRRHLQFSNAI